MVDSVSLPPLGCSGIQYREQQQPWLFQQIVILPAVNIGLIILVKVHVQMKCFNIVSPLKCKVAASSLLGRNFSFLGPMHTYLLLHPHLGWKDTEMLLQYCFKLWKQGLERPIVCSYIWVKSESNLNYLSKIWVQTRPKKRVFATLSVTRQKRVFVPLEHGQ